MGRVVGMVVGTVVGGSKVINHLECPGRSSESVDL